MAEPFLAEIRLMSFVFAPKGWASCNGQQLPINQNQALFSLLGTTWGGNGQTTFALPDLRGRVPIHQGQGHPLGDRGGVESHALTLAQLPSHTHQVRGSGAAGTSGTPDRTSVLAGAPDLYGPADELVALRSDAVTSAGGSQPHQNVQPSLVLSWCIALQGIFPSPT